MLLVDMFLLDYLFFFFFLREVVRIGHESAWSCVQITSGQDVAHDGGGQGGQNASTSHRCEPTGAGPLAVQGRD